MIDKLLARLLRLAHPLFVADLQVGDSNRYLAGPFLTRAGAQKYIDEQSPADFGSVQGRVKSLLRP